MSDEPENITAVLLREIRDELRGLRREVVDVRTLTLGTFDRMKRLERRLEETRDDLETTIKAENGHRPELASGLGRPSRRLGRN